MNEKTDPGKDTPVIPKDNPALDTPKIVNGDPEKPATEKQLEEVEQKMSAFERSTIHLTRVNVGVVAATCVFIALQWSEMRCGSRDTHDLAEAAKKQASAGIQQMSATVALATEAKTSADAAKVQADNTVKLANAAGDQVRKLEALGADTIAQNKVLSDQLDAMNRSMTLSEKQSRAALDASTNTLQIDQRPWVDIETVSVVDKWYWEPVNRAYRITIAFGLRNTGKTPAQGVWVSPRIVPSAFDTTLAQNDACMSGHLPGVVVFVNKPITQTIELSLNQSDIDAYNLRSSYDGKPEHGVIQCCGNQTNPGIVGCVGYYSGFSSVPLLTGFSYDLRLNERAGGVGGPASIPLNRQDIPGARFLILENQLSNGNWAK